VTDATTWMPLYIADYLKDTRHLSTLENGAYLQLLMHAWTNDGLLPSEETRIARIAGMTAKEWKASAEVLLAFFTPSEQGFRHNRVERELERAGVIIEQRRAAGRAAGKASAAARKAQRESNDRSTNVATNVQRKATPSQSHSKKVPLDKSNGADPEKIMFDAGLEMLTSEGRSEATARSVLGKWKKAHGPGAVIEALGAAQRLGVVGIVPWCEARWHSTAKAQSFEMSSPC
jgi:uncharacterized protein YdaU (DUF1376 family)